jgi:ABC-type bacteriocin/lantibiotic exporter with double-glycine peptidase domain
MLKLSLQYLKKLSPWGLTLLFTFLLSVVAVVCDLVPIYLTKIIFDVAYPQKDFSMLNIVALMTVAIYAARFFIHWCVTILRESVAEEYLLQLRQKLFAHICQLPLEQSQKLGSGDLVVRLNEDCNVVEDLVITNFLSLLQQLCFLLLTASMAYTLSPMVTLLVLLSLPLYLIEMKIFTSPLLQLQEKQIQEHASVMSFVLDKIRHLAIIKAYNQENNYAQKFRAVSEQEYRSGIGRNFLRTLALLSNSLTLQIWGVFCFWYLGSQVLKGELSIGGLFALLAIMAQLGGPIAALSSVILNWQLYAVSLRRVDDIFKMPIENDKIEINTKQINSPIPRLEIKNLNYSYPDGAQAIDNLNIEIPGPGLYVIAGVNGAGKSTLVQLLLHLRQKNSGDIFFNGTNTQILDHKQWRQMIAYVPQEGAILHESIVENLMLDPQSIFDDARVLTVLQKVGAMSFIKNRKHGLDSIVAEDAGLSVGQKQRLALARAILKDSDFIIMDEPTAALDANTDRDIREIIKEMAKTKCLIVVAHQAEFFQAADNIFVLQAGRCVEAGRYQELLHSKGQLFHLLTQSPAAHESEIHDYN